MLSFTFTRKKDAKKFDKNAEGRTVKATIEQVEAAGYVRSNMTSWFNEKLDSFVDAPAHRDPWSLR